MELGKKIKIRLEIDSDRTKIAQFYIGNLQPKQNMYRYMKICKKSYFYYLQDVLSTLIIKYDNNYIKN